MQKNYMQIKKSATPLTYGVDCLLSRKKMKAIFFLDFFYFTAFLFRGKFDFL